MAYSYDNWTKTTCEWDNVPVMVQVPPMSDRLIELLNSNMKVCSECYCSECHNPNFDYRMFDPYVVWTRNIERIDTLLGLEGKDKHETRWSEKLASVVLLAIAIGIIAGTCLGIRASLSVNSSWLPAVIGAGGVGLFMMFSLWAGYRGKISLQKRAGIAYLPSFSTIRWRTNDLVIGAFAGCYRTFSGASNYPRAERLIMSESLKVVQQSLTKLFTDHVKEMRDVWRNSDYLNEQCANRPKEIDDAHRYFVEELPEYLSNFRREPS